MASKIDAIYELMALDDLINQPLPTKLLENQVELRLGRERDILKLMRLEEACWPDHMRASREEILARMQANPYGQVRRNLLSYHCVEWI